VPRSSAGSRAIDLRWVARRRCLGDTDCFKFGGYTSGGGPELMAIDAPVVRTAIEEIQQAAGRGA
jgi:hypothetical protein